MPYCEATTVENPILDWLQSPELGWRFEDAKAVASEYRVRTPDGAVDERGLIHQDVKPGNALLSGEKKWRGVVGKLEDKFKAIADNGVGARSKTMC